MMMKLVPIARLLLIAKPRPIHLSRERVEKLSVSDGDVGGGRVAC